MRWTRRIWLEMLPFYALAGALTVSDAWGQVVLGRVTDRVFGVPLEHASVFLLTPDGAHAAVALSDKEGRYRLRAPTPGRYGLLVERFGYRAHLHAAVFLAAGDSLAVDLALDADPFVLDPVRVEGQRKAAESGRAAFAWRCALGLGYCFDPDSLQRMRPRFPSDVIRLGVPEMLVTYTGPFAPAFRPVNHWPCVRIFRDHSVEPISGEAFEAIGVGEIAAIEVYLSFAKTPLDVRSGLRAPLLWPDTEASMAARQAAHPCGVILVWTKAAW